MLAFGEQESSQARGFGGLPAFGWGSKPPPARISGAGEGEILAGGGMGALLRGLGGRRGLRAAFFGASDAPAAHK